MHKRVAAVALLSGACLAMGAAAADRSLVVGNVAKATAANDRALERLVASPATRDLRIVQLDPAAVAADTRRLTLDIGGRRVAATLAKAERSASGNLVWAGTLDGGKKTRSGVDPLNSATLVRSSDGITGTVRVNGALFRIQPLMGGAHAIVEVNESMMPADHPADAYRQIFEAAAAAKAPITTQARPCNPRKETCGGGGGGTPTEPGPTATIRVQVVATDDAIAAYGGNMAALVDLAVAESNQGYVNSNVGINMVLASYSTTPYATAGMSTDLSRFRGTNDGYMDNIHALRDSSGSDMVMLVANDAAACGLASGIGSTASTAFATAYWDCITGYYSFAHEFGHLQSARHDPATDGTNTPYAYGHGYRYGSSWRTIMAYNCSPSCPRINYWSNPAVLYGGVAMGTYDVSHNQRVLVNTKATIAAFRP
jgi:peptidyl-Asp metalloendopeptidase